ncbi:hypothetical protein OH76DRAFT_1416838 [Lentinus brumalis]|uniref:Uncharacterized protein n=1 Tax=Lentinus brumalis TaxID=2498619 RepID=A0A371DIE8_9APHY|nr:hypothetical protein OH76DRAFT_1416838 [Polyporus brumalis]
METKTTSGGKEKGETATAKERSTAERTEREDRTKGEGGERTGDDQREATVYAWWKAYGNDHEKTGGQRTHTHVYATRFHPSMPLDMGQRVKIVALAKDRTTITATSLEEYQPYEPHVVGTVDKIERSSPGWARVSLNNECRGNRVGRVEVEIPFKAGVTISIGRLNCPGEGVERTYHAPRDKEGWREKAECGARGCRLMLPSGRVERTIRMRPARRGDGAYEDLRATGEGTLAMHLWMRYDYAK